MSKVGWPMVLRIFLMFSGSIWLIGLFLPSNDHNSVAFNSGLTAEKIYTALTDTGTLANLFIGDFKQGKASEGQSDSVFHFNITKAYPFQYIAFQFQPHNLSIENLECEIQLSPDESGNKVELRCRITIGNHPVDKWKYWMNQLNFDGWLKQKKDELIQMLKE